MSWARFGRDSDVYVFALAGTDDADGDCDVECCACSLQAEPFESVTFTTKKALADHLKEHEARGHKVPQRVWDRFADWGRS